MAGQQQQLFTAATHGNGLGQQLQFMPQSAFVQQPVMSQQFMYPNAQVFPGGGNFIISTPGQIAQPFSLQLQQPNPTTTMTTAGRRGSQPQAIRPSINQGVRPTQVVTQQIGGQQVLTVVQSQPQLMPGNKTIVTGDKKNIVVTQNIQPRPAQSQGQVFPRLGSQIIATPTQTSYIGQQFLQPGLNPGLWTTTQSTPVFIRPQTDAHQTQIQYLTPQLQFPINVPGNPLQMTSPAVNANPSGSTVVAQTSTTASPTVTKHRPLAARPSPVTSTATPTTASKPSVGSETNMRPVKPKPSPVKSSDLNTSNISVPGKTTPNVRPGGTPTVRPMDSRPVKSSAMVTSSSTSDASRMKPSVEVPAVNGHKHIPIRPTTTSQRPSSGGLVSKTPPVRKDTKDAFTGQDAVFTPHNRETRHPPEQGGLRNGHRNSIPSSKSVLQEKRKDALKARDSDQILVHVIEDFVIEESPKPFPITRSLDSPAKENGHSIANETTSTMNPVLQETPLPKKKEGNDLCPSCLKPGLKSRLKTKDGVKVCSECAGRKPILPSINTPSRLTLINPVTSSLAEYDFSDADIPANSVHPGMSDRKKPRMSKSTTPVNNSGLANKIPTPISGGPKRSTPVHMPPDSVAVTPSSSVSNGVVSEQQQSPDPTAGLFIPASGKNPMKWSVSIVI